MNFWRIKIPKSIIVFFVFIFILSMLRVVIFWRFSFLYIFWNILLAFIPFVISSVLLSYAKEGKFKQIIFIIIGIFWLLFLPNAPYLVTDLIHIGEVKSAPIILDSLLLFASAFVGLTLGILSIFHIDEILKMRYSKRISFAVILVVVFFTSFGMYIGRFLRFNSWDVFFNHSLILKSFWRVLSQSTHHSQIYLTTFLFFFFMLTSYVAFRYINIK